VNWRQFNLYLVFVNLALTAGCVALWAFAWLTGFIGNTKFIGHVSMFALVLAALSSAASSLAAWRSDVPTDEGKESE